MIRLISYGHNYVYGNHQRNTRITHVRFRESTDDSQLRRRKKLINTEKYK